MDSKPISEAYAYCPRCGTQFANVGEPSVCTSCGLHNYINARPCVGALILHDNKYLLTQRAIEPRKGAWDLPGGFAKTKESYEQALVREIKEELGVELADYDYFGSYIDDYPYQNVAYPILVATFVCSLVPGAEPKAADDVAGYKWVSREELKTVDLAFASLSQFVRDYIQLLD